MAKPVTYFDIQIGVNILGLPEYHRIFLNDDKPKYTKTR